MPAASSKKKSRREAGVRARLPTQDRRTAKVLALDVRSKEFAEEAHRESLAVANSPSEADDQAFIDSISEWNDE